jgi:MFS family permease
VNGDKRRGFALIATGFFINMLGTTLPTPLYPLYEQRYHLLPVIITVVFATYAFAVVAGLLLFGHQSDRLGRRAVLLPGLALSALSAIAFLVAHGLAALLVGRVLSGLSAGIFTGAGTAALIDFAPAERRRAATLAAVVANIGGLSMGTLAAGLMAQYVAYPLRTPYAVDLVLAVLGFIAVFAAPKTVQVTSKRFRLQVRKLRIPGEMRATFTSAAVAGMGGFAVSGVFSAVAPVLLAAQLHVRAPAIAGVLVFLIFAASCAGQIVIERLPKHAAFAIGSGLLLAGLASLAAAIAASSLALLFLSSGLSGIGQGIVIGFGLANINERVEAAHRGEVTSTYFVLLYLGLAVPVIGVGLVAMATGLQIAGFIFCGFVAVAVSGAMLWPRNERARA